MESIRKRLLLIPSAYSKRAQADIWNFINYYKDDFEVVVLVKDIDADMLETAQEMGFTYVDVEKDEVYADYLKYTSEYVIDAGSLDSRHKISEAQNWTSVWHGIPYKKMFIDFDVSTYSLSIQYSFAYDKMISMSPFYTNVFLRDSMGYKNEVLEIGSSKADSIINVSPEEIELLKKQLEIPENKKIVLYAPTFIEEGAMELPFNPEKLLESFGDEYIILVRLHYLSTLKEKHPGIIDATDYPSVIPLMHVSDLLISDYSSLIMDYALLNKPIILFQYDQSEYFMNRDVYFDFSDYLPAEQIAINEDELYEKAKDIQSNDYAKLKEYFYPYEKGTSTAEIVTALNFDATRRETNEIVFLVNTLNELGGAHSFVLNMAKYYKEKYNTKIYLISIREFPRGGAEILPFESPYIDFTISYEVKKNACESILSKTEGTIISIQFSAHLHFQDLLKNKNSILMFHGNTKDIVDKTLYKWQLDALNNCKLYNYKKLILLTKKNVDVLLPHLAPEIADKTDYIVNSIPVDMDLCANAKDEKDYNSFVFVGRLDEEKNPLALVEIGKIIKESEHPYKIFVYGTGVLKELLEKAILDNGLEDIILLQGYCSDKREMYSKGCGLLLLSKSEGLPLTILEAYSFGLPAIIFDSFTSASDIVTDKTGYLIQPWDYDAFVDSMSKIKEININDINNHLQQFSNDTVFETWNNLFSQIDEQDAISQTSVIKTKDIADVKEFFRKVVRRLSGDYVRDGKRPAKALLRPLYYNLYELAKANMIRKSAEPPTVSIVVPYYHSKYILETLDSIFEQRYKNLEIVIVNDGADTEIEEKIKGLNDSRIRYYYKENGGLSSARNYGIDKATGDYVFFLDADDLLYKGAISNLLSAAIKYELDVVAGLTVRRDQEKNIETYWYYAIYKRNRVVQLSTNRVEFYRDTLSTNKLYRREFLNDNKIRFREMLYEDKVFISEVYMELDKIGVVNRVIYVWRIEGENTSITTTRNVENFSDRIGAINTQLSFIPAYEKVHIVSLFCNHDFVIYAREYMDYDSEERLLMFELTRNFMQENTDNYYSKFVTSKAVLQCIEFAIVDDFDSFNYAVEKISIEYNAIQERIREEAHEKS